MRWATIGRPMATLWQCVRAVSLTNPGTGGPAGHFIMEDLDNPHGPVGLIELVTPRHLALIPSISSYVGMGLVPPVGEFTYDPTTGKTNLRWRPLSDSRLSDFLAASERMLSVLNERNTGGISNLRRYSMHPLWQPILWAVQHWEQSATSMDESSSTADSISSTGAF